MRIWFVEFESICGKSKWNGHIFYLDIRLHILKNMHASFVALEKKVACLVYFDYSSLLSTSFWYRWVKWVLTQNFTQNKGLKNCLVCIAKMVWRPILQNPCNPLFPWHTQKLQTHFVYCTDIVERDSRNKHTFSHIIFNRKIKHSRLFFHCAVFVCYSSHFILYRSFSPIFLFFLLNV